MVAFLAWWVIIQLFGLAALPLTRRVFAWLPDLGYAFSKTVGLLLVSYLLWLGAITGVLTNNSGGILLALFSVAIFSTWLNIGSLRQLPERLRRIFRENRGHILATEALFILAFAGWTLIRAYAPDKILPAGGEKYMEIAFLNGILNSPRFPPLDPWLAGFGISYYYFGYVMMAVLTRLSGVLPTIGFDLYDALLFALTAVSAYGVVSNLIRAGGGTKRAASGFGLLGALFVGGLGNLEGLLEGLYSSRVLPAAFWQWIDIPDLAGNVQTGLFYPGNGWWWWRASRVLHDLDLFNKPVIYQPIDEFPFFSFLLGDNHPHKLALPFVLLAIGLALNLLLRQKSPPQTGETAFPGGNRWLLWLRQNREGISLFLFTALVLGGLSFLNTWDFPIYLGLVMLAYAIGRYLRPSAAETGQDPAEHQAAFPESRANLLGIGLKTIGVGLGLGISAVLLYIFFYFGFSSQAGGILPYVFSPTRLVQYLVMFGPFVFILVFFVGLTARQTVTGRFPLGQALHIWGWIAGVLYGAYLLALLLGMLLLASTGAQNNPLIQQFLGNLNLGQGAAQILLARISDPWLFILLSVMLALAGLGILSRQSGALLTSTRFALLMTFFALALTLSTEFFYLRDSFGMRMNTIFKFYFQGWVMMACASAYAAWWIGQAAGRVTRLIFWVGALLLVTGGLVYPVMGIYSRADGFSGQPHLDAAASFAGVYPGHWAAQPDDWAAIDWLLQKNPSGGAVPRILEAVGVGYENAGRISAFTGFPTLLGWTNHEDQWRGGLTEVSRRSPVIETIFTTYSGSQAVSLLQDWGVRYLIIGNTERAYAGKLCQDAARQCDANRALEKFNQILTPVFTHGSTTVYRVPDRFKP